MSTPIDIDEHDPLAARLAALRAVRPDPAASARLRASARTAWHAAARHEPTTFERARALFASAAFTRAALALAFVLVVVSGTTVVASIASVRTEPHVAPSPAATPATSAPVEIVAPAATAAPATPVPTRATSAPTARPASAPEVVAPLRSAAAPATVAPALLVPTLPPVTTAVPAVTAVPVPSVPLPRIVEELLPKLGVR